MSKTVQQIPTNERSAGELLAIEEFIDSAISNANTLNVTELKNWLRSERVRVSQAAGRRLDQMCNFEAAQLNAVMALREQHKTEVYE